MFWYSWDKYWCPLIKSSIFEKINAILGIFGWFLLKFSIILADFYATRICFMKRIRIRVTKMQRIQTSSDPKHWTQNITIADKKTC